LRIHHVVVAKLSSNGLGRLEYYDVWTNCREKKGLFIKNFKRKVIEIASLSYNPNFF